MSSRSCKKSAGFSLLEALFAMGLLGGIVLLSAHFFLHQQARLQFISELQLVPEIRQSAEVYLRKNPARRQENFSQVLCIQLQEDGSYRLSPSEFSPERPYLLLEHAASSEVVQGTLVGNTQEISFLLPFME